MLGKLASSAKESLGVSDLLQAPPGRSGCRMVKVLYLVVEYHAVPRQQIGRGSSDNLWQCYDRRRFCKPRDARLVMRDCKQGYALRERHGGSMDVEESGKRNVVGNLTKNASALLRTRLQKKGLREEFPASSLCAKDCMLSWQGSFRNGYLSWILLYQQIA